MIKVVHRKGKHNSNIASRLYVLKKLMFAHKVNVEVQIGKRAFTEGGIPDWQKVCGWKNETFTRKVSESLVAWRYYDSTPEVCKYNRYSDMPNRFYVSNLVVAEDTFIVCKQQITRKFLEWMVATPWVEGVEDGSTLPNDVEYYLEISVLENVFTAAYHSVARTIRQYSSLPQNILWNLRQKD